MVEAPGTAPGSKTLIPQNRHYRSILYQIETKSQMIEEKART